MVSSLNTKVPPGDAFRLSGSCYTLEVPRTFCRGLSGSSKETSAKVPSEWSQGKQPLSSFESPSCSLTQVRSRSSDRACRSFLLVSAKPVTSRPRRKGPARPAGAEGFRRLPTAKTLSTSDSCLGQNQSKQGGASVPAVFLPATQLHQEMPDSTHYVRDGIVFALKELRNHRNNLSAVFEIRFVSK